MSDKGKNLAGFTDKNVLELIIQKNLRLDGDGDLNDWIIKEDPVNSRLIFSRDTPSGETTSFYVEPDGSVVYNGSVTFNSGFGLGGDLDMNDNDILNVDGISGNSGTGILTISADIDIPNSNCLTSTNTIQNKICINDTDGSILNTLQNVATSSLYGVIDGNNNGIGEFRITKGSSTTSTMDTTFTSNPFFIIDNSGNVGIGKTNPSVKLDVNGDITGANITTTGDINMTTNNRLNLSSDNQEYVVSDGVDMDFYVSNGLGMTLQGSGKNLNVQGNLRADAYQNSTGTQTLLNQTTLGSNVVNSSLTSLGTLTSLTMGGNLDMGTNDITNSTNITATNLIGTLTTASQPNITSTGTLTSLTMGGNLDMGTNDITNSTNITATNLTGTLQTASQSNITSLGTLTSLTTSGNISISNTKNIQSANTSTNYIYLNESDGVVSNTNQIMTASNYYNVFDSSNNGTGEFRITKGSIVPTTMDTTFDTNPFFMINNTGNVGIGTNNPSYTLDVPSSVDAVTTARFGQMKIRNKSISDAGIMNDNFDVDNAGFFQNSGGLIGIGAPSNDIVFYTGTDATSERLRIEDGGDITSDYPIFGKNDYNSRYNNGTQSIGDSSVSKTAVVITFDTLITNTSNITYSAGTFTFPTSANGLYFIQVNIEWGNNTNGNRFLELQHKSSGSSYKTYTSTSLEANGYSSTRQSLTMIANINANNDTLEAVCYQDSGGALNIGSSNVDGRSEIHIYKLGQNP